MEHALAEFLTYCRPPGSALSPLLRKVQTLVLTWGEADWHLAGIEDVSSEGSLELADLAASTGGRAGVVEVKY